MASEVRLSEVWRQSFVRLLASFEEARRALPAKFWVAAVVITALFVGAIFASVHFSNRLAVSKVKYKSVQALVARKTALQKANNGFALSADTTPKSVFSRVEKLVHELGLKKRVTSIRSGGDKQQTGVRLVMAGLQMPELLRLLYRLESVEIGGIVEDATISKYGTSVQVDLHITNALR